MNRELLKQCIALMLTKERWWVLPCFFLIGFCMPSLFTENYLIWTLGGIAMFPIAVIAMVTDVKIKENKEMMNSTIRRYVSGSNHK